MNEDYQLFHLGQTLFERLQEDGSGELLQRYVEDFEAVKRTLTLLQASVPRDQAAAAAVAHLEESLQASEKIVHAAVRTFGPPSAVSTQRDSAADAARTTGFLLNTSLLGVELQYHASVRTLLDALIQMQPKLAVAKLLHAHLLCRASDAFEGRHELLRLIEEFPGFHMASAMLALEDREANMAGWRGLAESVAEQGSDPTSEKVVHFVLGR
jgi:Bacterial type III secretion protein (HrpB1_HrpK)